MTEIVDLTQLFEKLGQSDQAAWKEFEAAHPCTEDANSQLHLISLKRLYTYSRISRMSDATTEEIDVPTILNTAIKASGHPEAAAFQVPRSSEGMSMDHIANALGLVDGKGVWSATHDYLFGLLPDGLRSQLAIQRVMMPR